MTNYNLFGATPSPYISEGIHTDTGTEMSRDPITGRPVIHVPEFGRDPERMQTANKPVIGGIDADLYTILDTRQKALKALSVYGIEPPKSILDALAIHAAIDAISVDTTVPLIRGLAADKAVETLTDYVDRKARNESLLQAKTLFKGQAIDQVVSRFGEALDEILPKLASHFDKEAAVFTEAYETVKAVRSIEEAANLDEDGKGVADWHRARKAAAAMNKIADVVLAFGFHNAKSRGDDAAVAHVPTVTADVGNADIAPMWGLHHKLQKGLISGEFPFGIYPVQVATGAPLSLPASTEDWDDRREAYLASLQDHGMGMFR